MPTTPFDFVSLSATFGLIATGLLTLNLLLGVLISTHVRRVPEWLVPAWRRVPARIRHVGLYPLHNWTAYSAIVVALVHPGLLLLDAKGRFSLLNLLVPLTAPHQRYIYTLGAVALYGLLAVVATSTAYVRGRFSNRVWKRVHVLSYGAASLFLVHGLWADPLLLDRPVNFIDAEKVLSEAGIVLLAVAAFYRLRARRDKRLSETFHSLRVVEAVRETDAVTSFALEVPRPLRARFRYRPGQFVTLLVRRGDGFVKRSYSLTSAPGTDAPETDLHLGIAVKRLGPVSNLLADSVRVGDVLRVLPPAGSFFQHPAREVTGYVFFAAGSGITAFMSIAASVLATRPDSRIALVYANPDERSILFRDRLERLQHEHPDRFAVFHVLSRPVGVWPGRAGRLTPDALGPLIDEALAGLPAATEYAVCGPDRFTEMVEGMLLGRGVPAEAIHAERFSFSPDAGVEDRPAAVPLDVGDAHAPRGAGPPVLTVRVNGTSRVVECRNGETVLDAALRGGALPPFSCQEGVCASCKATVERGQVRMWRHEALTPLEADQTCILACTAVPLSSEVSVTFGSPGGSTGDASPALGPLHSLVPSS